MNGKTDGQVVYEAWRGDNEPGDVAGALVPPWRGLYPGDVLRWERGAEALAGPLRAEASTAEAEAGRYRSELENAIRIMMLSRGTADAALAIRERTGLLPLKRVSPS